EEVECSFLVGHEAGVEHRAFVAAVGADNGKAALQGGNATRGLGADGVGEAAIQAAATLEEETAVPVIGHVDGETQRIGTPVDTGATVDLTFEVAMRRQRGPGGCP